MPVKVSFQVEGVRDLVKRTRSISREISKATEEGLIEAGEFLKEKSNAVAPIRDGNLIDESFVVAEPKAGTKTVVYMGYGPPGSISEDYAIVQHEKYEQKRTPGRQWKYLEEPFRSNGDKMIKIVQERVAGAIK